MAFFAAKYHFDEIVIFLKLLIVSVRGTQKPRNLRFQSHIEVDIMGDIPANSHDINDHNNESDARDRVTISTSIDRNPSKSILKTSNNRSGLTSEEGRDIENSPTGSSEMADFDKDMNENEDDAKNDPMTLPTGSKKSKRIKARALKRKHSSDSKESMERISSDSGDRAETASKASSIIDDLLEYFDLDEKCTPRECMCFTCIFFSIALLLSVGAVVLVLTS